MQIPIARQGVMDLKEVLGRHAENLDQRILDRRRHFADAGRVILTFEHVDFCERHVLAPDQRLRREGVAAFSSGPVVPTVPPFGGAPQIRSTRSPRSVQTGCFNTAVSIGSFRRRLPVAAKTALVTAGTMAEVPASPIPPGGSELCTICTSIAGASLMRSIS